MNELINVEVKNDTQIVSARELYKGLEIAQRFSRWVSNNWSMFEEGTDFNKCTSSTVVNNGGVRQLDDYEITIDMAKQLAMMVRTEKGKQYRKYFLELERKWNDPQEVVKRGYAILQNENARLKIENQAMKPKALFADSVAASHTIILIGELAKILRGNGINIGANRLFQWMRDQGYLISRKGTDYNMPTQRSMNLGLFKIKESTITHSNGSVSISKTTKVTGKGQQYFINKFMKMNETAIG
ncbi:phage antirepressor KilAC domain-containing protein [Ligilactobacillus salivarius]|uniref:phage antirepressor KilAC domain-containing protein n=1 Tax=Ligilactobacillus salivarius TaxID=1624 RepID=UPI0025A3BAD3|nr:phage antirepressor KilAC domain-containing protein [Ligilactobacillus salivarius]MDM8261898.1 phage antirepressor KilAC domain-containing protein [Ligilactobacillus salivarius]